MNQNSLHANTHMGSTERGKLDHVYRIDRLENWTWTANFGSLNDPPLNSETFNFFVFPPQKCLGSFVAEGKFGKFGKFQISKSNESQNLLYIDVYIYLFMYLFIIFTDSTAGRKQWFLTSPSC